MNLKDVEVLFEYDRWANDRILEIAATLTDEQLGRKLGSSFDNIAGTLAHIYGADWIWLERWKGHSPTTVKVDDIGSIRVLRERWTVVRSELDTLLKSLTMDALHAPLAYRDFKGASRSEPLWQQMQHRVNHSSYHRGQLTSMLRQVGANVVGTDLITFHRLQQV